MPKCMKVDCKSPATKALKLTFRNKPDGPGVAAYVALVVCDEVHMPEEEVAEFYTTNFEVLCLCMEEIGAIKPDNSLTKFEWVPLAEAEKNWGDAIEEARRNL